MGVEEKVHAGSPPNICSIRGSGSSKSGGNVFDPHNIGRVAWFAALFDRSASDVHRGHHFGDYDFLAGRCSVDQCGEVGFGVVEADKLGHDFALTRLTNM
jgi:hypothetical protein